MYIYTYTYMYTYIYIYMYVYRYSFYKLISDFNVLLEGTNKKIGVLIISLVKIFTNGKNTSKTSCSNFVII